MLNMVSKIYVEQLLKKAELMLNKATGIEAVERREIIFEVLGRIKDEDFCFGDCEYIYEGLGYIVDTRESAIRLWILTCLSLVPNNCARCYKLIEIGTTQLMLGHCEI